MISSGEDLVSTKAQVVKLHKQFGHATSSNLRKLLINAGITTTSVLKMIDVVVNECDSCPRYKKQPPRPAVGLSKADDFDESVAMDLHEIDSKLWYMHIIDEFSRFSNAQIIRSKDMSVRTFMKSWISIFGAPRKVFSDNGGEFIGDDFFDMCETFGNDSFIFYLEQRPCREAQPISY